MPTKKEIDDLRADKLPYQQGCALMAIAKTERKNTTMVLSEMKKDNGLSSGKDLQHEKTLETTLDKRGYKAVKPGVMSWKQAQDTLREQLKASKGPVPNETRYFAMTYGPNADLTKEDTVGHAVSVGISKSGGINVYGNNSDRSPVNLDAPGHKGNDRGEWLGSKLQPGQKRGMRPFQATMTDSHQVKLFSMPSPGVKKK